MPRSKLIAPVSLLLASVLLISPLCGVQPSAPETVLATYRVKPERLAAFLELMPSYWAALRAQNLVLKIPHVALQGEEHGKPVVVEVFSWKDHNAPEHVPAAIQRYWDKINEMVESRDGHPGVEFPEMKLVKQN